MRDEYLKIVNDIRSKWEKAEKLVLDCDPKSVFALSDVDILIERTKEYKYGKDWRLLSEDQEILKKEFAVGCVCDKKKSEFD